MDDTSAEIRALLRSIHSGDFCHGKAIAFRKRFVADFNKCIGSEVDSPLQRLDGLCRLPPSIIEKFDISSLADKLTPIDAK